MSAKIGPVEVPEALLAAIDDVEIANYQQALHDENPVNEPPGDQRKARVALIRALTAAGPAPGCVNCDSTESPEWHTICDNCFTHKLEEPLFPKVKP